MAFNGSGTFARIYNWVTDKANNVKITASRVDAEMDGFATGLSTCITKDGQTTVTANLPMATYRHTGVGNASARTDYLAAGQAQDDSIPYVSTVGGTANAITLTPSPAITAYAAGQRFKFLAGASNTSTVTVAISGLTTKAIQLNGVALAGGEIVSGKYYIIEYDGTAFQLLNARHPQIPLWCGTGGGTANAQTATPSPAITAYETGGRYGFTANATNTAAATLAISGLTAKNVYLNGAALVGGEIVSGRIYTVLYDGTQFNIESGAGIEQGIHEFYVPASAMVARTTNGAAAGSTETSTNDVMIVTKDFDQTTAEGAQFSVSMPKSWDEGTVTFVPYWTAASGSGGVVWSLAGMALSDDDLLDTAFGTAQTSTDTLIATTDLMVGPESSAITIAGTPAAGDLVFFQVARVPGDASDTLNADAKLLGVRIRCKVNSGNDA